MRKIGVFDRLRGVRIWPALCCCAAVLFLVLCSAASAVSAQAETDDQAEADEALIPPLMSASVHDPSIIKVGDTYYVFGSHLAAAKSTDLRNWKSIETRVHNGNRLIPNVYTELEETFKWAQTDTLWAPDVAQLPDGRFYMYYCACRGDSPLSALGVAVADDIEGPYKNLGIIFTSGGLRAPDGSFYDATRHPNVVDPQVFFDAQGKLWMVYGSYSGGIFILEMDPATGFPYPDQGYGKKLVGGNHSRIEGPYILYNPATEYYYLFLSFGGLDSRGGYNIRVARSKNPGGPYYDSEGKNMVDAHGPRGSFFDDRAIEPYGVKLVGNFLFRSDYDYYGYTSPGHNSAYHDPESDRYFVIMHTRFPRTGEYHEVRTHQIFFNEDGWPVMSVLPYAYESAEEVSVEEVVADYLFVNHGKDISSLRKTAVEIALNEDGTVTGEVAGTWQLRDGYLAELTIDGSLYKGVFVRQWDPSAAAWVMTFSALSEKGVSIWGKELLTELLDSE